MLKEILISISLLPCGLYGSVAPTPEQRKTAEKIRPLYEQYVKEMDVLLDNASKRGMKGCIFQFKDAQFKDAHFSKPFIMLISLLERHYKASGFVVSVNKDKDVASLSIGFPVADNRGRVI